MTKRLIAFLMVLMLAISVASMALADPWIDVISVGGSVNGSINKGINEVKDYLAWIDDEYPGVSEVKDFD